MFISTNMQQSQPAKFFKITNDSENHFGFQYKTGLNVDIRPFQEFGTCVPGGLYFTTLEHIHRFYSYGIWLREVFLPTNNSEFKMVADGEHKFRANMIILGERHSLDNVGTVVKFGLKNIEFSGAAFKTARLDTIKELISRKHELAYTIRSPVHKFWLNQIEQNIIDVSSPDAGKFIESSSKFNSDNALNYISSNLGFVHEYLISKNFFNAYENKPLVNAVISVFENKCSANDTRVIFLAQDINALNFLCDNNTYRIPLVLKDILPVFKNASIVNFFYKNMANFEIDWKDVNHLNISKVNRHTLAKNPLLPGCDNMQCMTLFLEKCHTEKILVTVPGWYLRSADNINNYDVLLNTMYNTDQLIENNDKFVQHVLQHNEYFSNISATFTVVKNALRHIDTDMDYTNLVHFVKKDSREVSFGDCCELLKQNKFNTLNMLITAGKKLRFSESEQYNVKQYIWIIDNCDKIENSQNLLDNLTENTPGVVGLASNAITKSNVESIEKLLKYIKRPTVSKDVIVYLFRSKNISMLNWVKDNCVIDKKLFQNLICFADNNSMLNWWVNSGLYSKCLPCKKEIKTYARFWDLDVKEWWRTSFGVSV